MCEVERAFLERAKDEMEEEVKDDVMDETLALLLDLGGVEEEAEVETKELKDQVKEEKAEMEKKEVVVRKKWYPPVPKFNGVNNFKKRFFQKPLPVKKKAIDLSVLPPFQPPLKTLRHHPTLE